MRTFEAGALIPTTPIAGVGVRWKPSLPHCTDGTYHFLPRSQAAFVHPLSLTDGVPEARHQRSPTSNCPPAASDLAPWEQQTLDDVYGMGKQHSSGKRQLYPLFTYLLSIYYASLTLLDMETNLS